MRVLYLTKRVFHRPRTMSTGAQQTIRVDAFDTNLHGAKILAQGPFPNNRLPPLMDYVQHFRDPFKKRVLLTRSPFALCKTISLNYDATYLVSDVQDWSLALTYILHCPKPALVVIDDVPVPDAVWTKFTRAITVAHIATTPVRTMVPYDAVFFAPIQDIGGTYADFVFRQIQNIFRASYTQKEYRDILQELRVAEAGLMWTRWDESVSAGSMYWYDPVSNQRSDTLSKKQLSDIFLWLHNQCVE